MSSVYEIRSVGFRYGSLEALQNVSLTFDDGQFVAVAGPNGAGKSTLLGVMAGLHTEYSGECLFHGKSVRRWKRRDFAKLVSVVPQTVRIEFPFTAEQVVLMGRTPHADAMFESAEDIEHVEQAMRLTQTLDFRSRDFRSLSGGERQRVILASALAQAPEVLLLDEPATYLDLEHQISLYRLLRSLAANGLLVVTITHDLNLASAYAGRIIAVRAGAIAADGTPAEVFRPEILQDVFRVDARVEPGPAGRPWIQYGD